MLIGINGYAGSGKDSVGAVLVTQCRFHRRALADKMRDVALAINPWVAPSLRLSELVQTRGWEGAKRYPEVRRLLQRIGRQAGRDIFGESVWTDLLFADIDRSLDYVITDVRYRSDAIAIKARGGDIWRVDRPGIEPANAHDSETDLDGWPFEAYVLNDGTLDDLERRVLSIVSF